MPDARRTHLIPSAPPISILSIDVQDHVYEEIGSVYPEQPLPATVDPDMSGRDLSNPPPVPPRRPYHRSSSLRPLSCDISITKPLIRSNTTSNDSSWSIKLVEKPQGSNARIASLCSSIAKLMSKYPHSRDECNTGIVWARVSPLNRCILEKSELIFNVAVPWHQTHLPYKTPLTRTAQSLIEDVFTLLDQAPNNSGQFFLKLCDSEEYLKNEEMLGYYERIQVYQKYNQEVPVRIVHRNSVEDLLARDDDDDQHPFHFKQLLGGSCVFNTARLSLQERLNSYSKEVNKLLKTQCANNVNQIVGEVQTISDLLCGISSIQLEEAIGGLRRINPMMLCPAEMYDCQTALVVLHHTLGKLLHVFFDNFYSDFGVQEVHQSPPVADVDQNKNTLRLNLAALYKLQPSWLNSFDHFSISCSLKYLGKNLTDTVLSENISTALSFGNKLQCNRLVVFPVEIRKLPYESMLQFRLLGCKQGKSPELLGWAVLPVFSNKTLVSGTVLLSMSMLVELTDPPSPALSDSHRQATGVILQLEFPEEKQWKYERPVAFPGSILFTKACEELNARIVEVSQKHCLALLTPNERSLLWDKRYHCNERNSKLHLVLGCAPWWRPENLTEIYTILDHWRLQSTAEALFLLSDNFQDQTVRQVAVRYLEQVSDSELEDYLPQLVQAVKMEWELDGPLVMFLLGRSLCSIRIAQQLYWLLVDAQEDAHYKSWYVKIQAALKHCCGQLLRLELEVEGRLVTLLTQLAERIRTADKGKRKDVLKKEKWKICEFFKDVALCRLPLDPAIVVKGVDIDGCMFFNSNTAPLCVPFIIADPMGKNVRVICKTGDNLHQDMLVLQIVRAMDRVWLQEGLDMRMVTYKCLSTGRDQGLVEVVPDAVTLGKIQQEWGLGGALREDTLEKWFHMRNKTKNDYEEAVMNFLHSCAGWCVATFVLGICDRHNDNIMLKHSGHMFHIDFGKIMGNAQKFASIKRDRTPFVFTPEMQNFITGGGENPQRLHRFVELCCEAYNTLRKHTTLVLSLLQLMLGAGMPQMKDVQDLQYVHNNLRPHDSELEATSYFTKKIKESMDSLPVKINFFIHTMVQLPPGKRPPSSAPALMATSNDNIQEVVIQKYTVNGKEVKYELKITIEDGYLFSEKTFDQFEMIHRELQKHFIESTLPSFPITWFKMSFTPARRMAVLNKYLKELFEGPCKGNEFVCSLFLDGPAAPGKESVPKTKPQIQLYISYKDFKLSVMVKHLSNIRLPNGSCPDAYVVIRLVPENGRNSKRKTKVVRNNDNPTFNELIEYSDVFNINSHVLEVTVKSKKAFVAATNVVLGDKVLNQEQWFPLGYSEV
ncbi:phosphatidylinositol 4-phosphate 3-kinase C2 domain-containing subunit gamma [Chanos chanos]|uniref:Phosphatidylinositol 4-phosphate 3-kinase C2 domain-containing subunit gamma n=1 Tax=Chanos chanos TaxID=29144 RepID=A0A6J2W7L4_CHACN|nr:phosphatidylinositol 4-phosphate 3-kinase C2 domain-containing subunit gamma [Chanos chanos]